MAKQAVGAIERHVEKGVLGVTVLLLLGAAGVYLVSSPNTAEIGRQETAPGQVNERVRDAARTLRNRLQSARPEVDSVSDPLPGLQAGDGSVLAAANLPGTWPAPVPMMPRVPDIGNIVIEGQMELAEVIAPGEPRCKAGRSVVTLYPPVTMGREEEALEEEDYYYDQTTNWVTVAAAFDRREQERQCQLAGYKLGRRRAYLVGSELQRRRQRPDGTWPEDWENVCTYAPAIPPAPPVVEFIDLAGQKVPSPETRGLVQEYFSLIKEYQLDIIRPLFPEVVLGDDWFPPEMPGLPSYGDLDAEFDEERDIPTDEQPDGEPEKPKTQREKEQEQLKQIEQLYNEGRVDTGKDMDKLDEALDLAQSLVLGTDTTRGTQREAQEWVTRLEQARRDLERWRRQHPEWETEIPDEDETTPIAPVQVLWLHDAMQGSVASGATYQYRTRVLLYNRYAAIPGELKTLADAQQVFLVGPWSEPSAPVRVPHDTRFFLTSGRGDSVRVQVFKWFEGYWVDHKFTVEVGEPIGELERALIRLPDGTIDKPRVDFSTGSLLVDIVPDRTVRTVGKTRRDGTFDIGPAEETAGLIYMDSEGNLGERLVEIDKNDPGLKEMKDRLVKLKPPRKAKKKEPEKDREDDRERERKRRGRRGGRGGGGGGGSGGGGMG